MLSSSKQSGDFGVGFFTDEEIGSLRISNMILHVVSDTGFTPETARAVEHEEFFIERIRDTDAAAVYAFDQHSQTKAQLERMAVGADGFEQGAQALSREFARFHTGTVRDGAFFIFELACSRNDTRLYSLIKYDYQEAIEQAHENGDNLLRLIVQAFVADKKAIQKSALIRVVNGTADIAISARDRMKSSPDIGDYFANFLHVVRALSNEQLNKRMVEVLRETLIESRDILPDQDVPRAFRQAKAILRDRQSINEEAISEAVIAAAGHPEDERTRAKLQARISRKIRSAKLQGLAFPPDHQVLRKPPVRRVRTTEGITLTYPDDTDSGTVHRQALDGGGEIITIRTEQITEDRVVRDVTRGAT